MRNPDEFAAGQAFGRENRLRHGLADSTGQSAGRFQTIPYDGSSIHGKVSLFMAD